MISAISTLLEAGRSLITSIFGDAKQREIQQHARQMSVHDQFAAEFRNLTKRTWWDSAIDGLNRLPRPVMVALVIIYFLLAYFDPVEFQKVNVGLDTVPEPMWTLLGAIAAFYFAAREWKKSRDTKLALSAKQFSEVQTRMDQLETDDRYEEEMKDTTKPLSNAVIMEWNRRNNPDFKG